MAKAFPNTGVTVIDSSSDLPVASAALEGVLMFQKDSNELKICDGSNWIRISDSDNPSGLDFIEKITFSAEGSKSFSANVFNSRYDNYKMFVDITSASVEDGIGLRLRSGTTDLTSGYYTVAYQMYTGSDINSVSRLTNGTSYGLMSHSATYTPNLATSVEILRPNLAYRTVFQSIWNYAVNNRPYFGHRSGYNDNTTAYDSATIFINSGNMTGSATLYGYRSSRV